MNKLIEQLEKIEAAALGNARLEAIKKSDSPAMRRLFNWALSGDITFGIKQVPAPAPAQVASMGEDDWFEDLEEQLLVPLSARSLTGNTAKSLIASFLGACEPREVKWTERILKQDLRLSVGAKDINKVMPGTITLFSLPLAKPFKELKSLKGLWAVQPKMDGGRVVARLSKNGGPVKLISRTGKEWVGFDEIKLALLEVNQRLNMAVDLTLDGEVVVIKNGRMDFQAVQKLFHADDGRAADGEIQYMMFDWAPTTEYDNPTMNYGVRLDMLKKNANLFEGLPCLQIIDSTEVKDPLEVGLNNVAVDFVARLGCDGAIIRRLDKPPSNKKTSDITKIKPFEDAEAVIVGKVEGEGWLVGSLGKMECRLLVDKKPVGPVFGMGTGEGLTKELRQELWDDEKLIGKIVNFKYQRLSEDNFPVLPTYRAIRHPDDIG